MVIRTMFTRLRTLFAGKKLPESRQPLPVHSALIDSSTRAVIAVSDNVAAIQFLNESMMDTFHVINVTRPNHIYALPFRSDEPSLVHWVWDVKARAFKPTHPDVITPELRAQSELAMKKMRAVTHIMTRISMARLRTAPGIQLQDTVYQTKKDQAYAFRDTGYDEARVFEFPYVLQYADFADIGFREAADDIVLKAKLKDDFLAKTELLRLSYFKKLKNLTDAKDIRPLLEAFGREAFTNSIV